MKKYLVLHDASPYTEFMLCPDRTTIKVKCSFQNWLLFDTITCELIGGMYTPILFPTFDRLIVRDSYHTFHLYLTNYLRLVSKLPANFPNSITMDLSIKV